MANSYIKRRKDEFFTLLSAKEKGKFRYGNIENSLGTPEKSIFKYLSIMESVF